MGTLIYINLMVMSETNSFNFESTIFSSLENMLNNIEQINLHTSADFTLPERAEESKVYIQFDEDSIKSALVNGSARREGYVSSCSSGVLKFVDKSASFELPTLDSAKSESVPMPPKAPRLRPKRRDINNIKMLDPKTQ